MWNNFLPSEPVVYLLYIHKGFAFCRYCINVLCALSVTFININNFPYFQVHAKFTNNCRPCSGVLWVAKHERRDYIKVSMRSERMHCLLMHFDFIWSVFPMSICFFPVSIRIFCFKFGLKKVRKIRKMDS